MTPFHKLTAVAAPMLRDNIDTDIIIPSREIRSVSKKGLSGGLFAGWRYQSLEGREPRPDFVLNQPAYAQARILVSGENFGCGSSREHAVWALAEYGFRAIVAASFNPIFQGNCIANGLVPAKVSADAAQEMAKALENRVQPHMTVDLEAQTASLPDGRSWPFVIEEEARHMLLSGLDPIDQTLLLADEIKAFRSRDRENRPWIYDPVTRAAHKTAAR